MMPTDGCRVSFPGPLNGAAFRLPLSLARPKGRKNLQRKPSLATTVEESSGNINRRHRRLIMFWGKF